MILGKKVGMTQIFENEKLIPVTVIEAGSNFIVQIKTEEKEGYNSITLAFDDKKEKATGVRIIDANTGEMIDYFAKIIFNNSRYSSINFSSYS